MRDLIIRSISGLLYVILILFAALFSELSFILIIFIFSALALLEFQRLIAYKSPVPFLLFGIIVYQFYNQKLNPYFHLSLIGLCIGVHLLLTYFLFAQKKINLLPLQKTGLTIFYLVASSFSIIATSSFDSPMEN